MVDKTFEAIIHLLSIGYALEWFTTAQKKQLVVKSVDFMLIDGKLYKMGPDEILHRYVLEHKPCWIMSESHAGVTGGHYTGKDTMHKTLQVGLWWPTIHMDTKKFFQSCDVF